MQEVFQNLHRSANVLYGLNGRSRASKGIRTVITLCEIIEANDSLSRKDLAAIAEERIREAYFRDGP